MGKLYEVICDLNAKVVAKHANDNVVQKAHMTKKKDSDKHR